MLSPIICAAVNAHEKTVDLLEKELNKRLNAPEKAPEVPPQPGFWGRLFTLGKRARVDDKPAPVKVSKQDQYRGSFINELGYTFLHAAVESQKLNLVRKAVEVYKISPNCIFKMDASHWHTPIVTTARDGNQEFATYLLQNGAEIALKEHFVHPFVEAARRKNVGMLQFFLDKGVPIDSREGGNGKTALMTAVDNKDKTTAEFLISKKANLDVVHYNYYTALYIAVLNKDVPIVTPLIENGAQLTDPTGSSAGRASDYLFSPLAEAFRDNKCMFEDSMASVLMKYKRCAQALSNSLCAHALYNLFSNWEKNNNSKILHSWLPIFFSEETDHVGCLSPREVYANTEASEDTVNSYNEQCDKLRLFRAARTGDMEELELLLNPRQRIVYADTARIDADGNTPLHIACFHGQAQAVRYLLSKQADPNAKNKKNETPLMRAMDSPKQTVEIVRLLYTTTDLDTQDSDGKTALMLAINRESKKSEFDLLLTKPQNLELRSNDNYNAFLSAVLLNNLHAVTALIQHEVDILATVHPHLSNALFIIGYLVYEDRHLLAKKLIESGVPVDSRTSFDALAFENAVENSKNIDLSLTLLAPRLLFLIASQKNPTTDANTWDELFNLGGSLFQRDSHLRTLHHVAASSGNREFFKYLNNKFKKDAEKITKSAVDDEDNTVEKLLEVGGYEDCSYSFEDVDEHTHAFLALTTDGEKLAQAKRLLNVYKTEKQPEKQLQPAPAAAKSQEKLSGSGEVSLASSPFLEVNSSGKRKNTHEDPQENSAKLIRENAEKKSGKRSEAPALRR